ncbi:hypothetical protein [Streptomyces sodiiphilus]
MTRYAPDHDDSFRPRQRRLRRPIWVTAGVLAAALVAAALVWVPPRLACGLGSGLVERGGECIGVTDGSPAFVPGEKSGLEQQFRAIQALIKAENDSVAASGEEAVTVALLTSLTPVDGGPLSPQQTLRSMQGAYVAQKRANDPAGGMGDAQPKVRLHLANTGSRQTQWQPVAEELASMKDAGAPLVATVGGGVSTRITEDAFRALADEKIPMFAAVASADGLNRSGRTGGGADREGRIEGLVRITPSNTDFVLALKDYVKERGDLENAILLFDESEPDLHVATLTEAFRKHMAEEIGGTPDQPFSGSTGTDDAKSHPFSPLVRSICRTEADMVLFSGRTADLEKFLVQLTDRPCKETRQFAVLFAETGPALSADEEKTLGNAGITMVYASSYDPGWRADAREGEPVPVGFADFHRAFVEHLGEEDLSALESGDTERGQGSKAPDAEVYAALSNGYAVAHHDAVMAAVQAIRLSNEDNDGGDISAERVIQVQFNLNIDNVVEGAGGSLEFRPDRNGDPTGKLVPVIELPPAGNRIDPYVTGSGTR